MRGRTAWALGLLSVLGLAAGRFAFRESPAVAAPEVGSGSFNLPQVMQTQTIFTNQTTDPAGITVSVTSGEAAVEQYSGGNWTSLGNVLAGRACVFEGPFASVRLKANAPSTTGTFSNREPTDTNEGPDFVVGTGAVTLGAYPVRIYAAVSGVWRIVFLTAGSGEVALRATSTGPNLMTVTPDRFDCLRDSQTEYWLSGSGTVAFTVLEDPVPGTMMLLPEAHWSDEFSPLSTDCAGSVAEGDPTAAAPVDEPIASRSVWDEDNEEYDTVYYVEHEALVNFTPTASATTIRNLFEEIDVDIDSAWFDPDPEDQDSHISWFHIHVRETSEYYDALPLLLDYLNGLSCVECAEYNDVADACSDYPSGMRDEYLGAYVNGVWQGGQGQLAWLHAVDAWETQTGSPATYDTGQGIAVVVIDSGLQVHVTGSYPNLKLQVHPDLDAKIHTPSPNARFGIARQWGNKKYGRFALSPSYAVNFTMPTSEEDYGHGTCVAGIIGADTYNGNNGNDRGIGVAGAGPDLTIIPAYCKWKTHGSSQGDVGGPTEDSIVDIIKILHDDVALKGTKSVPAARVVNMSFAFKDRPDSIEKAIKKDLKDNPRLYVAAAGNTASEKKMYPAFWDDIVLGVTGAGNSGSGDAEDDSWGYVNSEYASTFWCGGKDSESSTPSHYRASGYWYARTTDYEGEGGYSTYYEDGNYATFWGTSASCAYVSALAGLVYSRAWKTGRLDGGVDDVTPGEVADLIAETLKSATIPLTDTYDQDKAIPGVVQYYDAVDGL